MKFVEPSILLLIPVAVILAAVLFIRAARKKRQMLQMVLGSHADDPQAVHLAYGRRRWKQILLVAALVLLIVAAARPYVNTVSRDVTASGSDVLVLFDVSKSMRAADLPPNRMEQAKYLLREIINAFPEDRFGIIPFAGTAFLSCPLTADHTALLEAVDDLNVESVPVGGTNIEKALQSADRAFLGADGDHRAVLLFTDGDELSGNTAKMIRQFHERNIPVAVAGFGNPAMAAPVPDGAGGVMRSADGKAAGSRLNESALQNIAAGTGGVYVRSTAGDTGFAVLKSFLQKLSTAGFERSAHREVDDLFPWFIMAALSVLILAVLLPERKFSKTLLILIAIGMFCTPLAAQETAAEAVLPDDPYELYAQGRKMQIDGNRNAAAYYEKAVQLPDAPGIIRAAALNNLGVFTQQESREQLNQCRAALDKQQLDEAQKQITQAEKTLQNARELYTRSMQFAADGGGESANNFQQLLLDHKQIDELKKAIEKLKQQQQQARQQTQQAQQQNQSQNQNQQGGQQNQSQNQNQQGGQQNQLQNGQQNQNLSPQEQTSQARRAAEELAKQADQLKQRDLAKQAREAEKDLQEAEKLQQQGKNSLAQQKLDDAAAKLGKPETPKPDKPQEQSAGNKPDKPQEKAESAAGAEEKSPEEKEKERANARKLELLDDESAALRDYMRRRRNMRRMQVEKDW